MPPARCGAYVHAFTLSPEEAEEFRGAVTGAAKPLRHAGVELRGLARPQHQVLLAQNEPQPPGQNVDPLVAFVDLE